jgi:RND family efflux transporter MFP subunit
MCKLSRRKRRAWNPALVGIGLLALVGPAVSAGQPPAVTVVQPVKREVTDHETFVGRLQPAQKVELRPRVTGFLEKIHFKPDAMVKKGDLLFEIDARPYKAALDKAEAEMTLAQARAKLAEKNLARLKRLRGTGAASQEDLDQAAGAHEEAQAMIGLARATVEQARIPLDFTRVVSPIDGMIGLPEVTPGNLVVGDRARSTLLATIVSLDPMYVYFDMDERTFLRMKRLELEGQLGKGPIPIAMGLADEKGFPHKGTVQAIDNQVNEKTGTIRVRGVLVNPRGLFFPGAFAKVRLPVGRPYETLLIPDRALGSSQGVKYVYVVNDKNVVEERKVQAGPLLDEGSRVVRAGLRPTDRVVVSGQQKLRPGLEVEPKTQK